MKVHQFNDAHLDSLNQFAGTKLDAFVMDPDDARLQLQVAHRLRPFLRSVGFPADQPVTRPLVSRLLRLAGVPDGMCKKHAQNVADFADNAWKAGAHA